MGNLPDEWVKTDHKNDKFEGARKYQQIQNDDGTVSFVDVTKYEIVGDEINAEEMNHIWIAIRGLDADLDASGLAEFLQVIIPQQVSEATKGLTDEIAGVKSTVETMDGEVKKNTQAIGNVETKANSADSKADKTLRFLKATLSSSGWSGSAPYSQTISVSEIKASDTPIVSAGIAGNEGAATIKKIGKEFGYIDRVTTSEGKITAYCYNKKPTVNIPIFIKGA